MKSLVLALFLSICQLLQAMDKVASILPHAELAQEFVTQYPEWTNVVSFSPCGTYAVAGWKSGIRILNLQKTEQAFKSIKTGNEANTLSFVFSEDGKTVVMRTEQCIFKFDLSKWDTITFTKIADIVTTCVALTKDGSIIATCKDGSVMKYECTASTVKATKLLQHPNAPEMVVVKGDYILVCFNDGLLVCYNLTAGLSHITPGSLLQDALHINQKNADGTSIVTVIAPLTLDKKVCKGTGKIAFSANGNYALVAMHNQVPYLWNINELLEKGSEAQPVWIRDCHKSIVSAVQLNVDGSQGAIGYEDGTITFLLTCGRDQYIGRDVKVHDTTVRKIMFNPDVAQPSLCTLSRSMKSKMTLWETKDNQVRSFTPDRFLAEQGGSNPYVLSAHWNPQGNSLLVAFDHSKRAAFLPITQYLKRLSPAQQATVHTLMGSPERLFEPSLASVINSIADDRMKAILIRYLAQRGVPIASARDSTAAAAAASK